MRLTTITAVIVIAFYACNVETQTAQEALPTGIWGGEGMRLSVTADGAAVDYGCDSGTIDEPLRSDSRSKINARGTYVFGRGGPRRPGQPAPKPQEAQYEGVRDGNKLQLTVLLIKLDRKLGPFTVELGKSPTLERCG